jgi:hypothetical protein
VMPAYPRSYHLTTTVDRLNSSDVKIVSLSVPFKLESAQQDKPSVLSNTSVPISLATVFNKSTPEAVASLRWALQQGRPVDIDVEAPISDEVLESFEDIIGKATEGLENIPPIILCRSHQNTSYVLWADCAG